MADEPPSESVTATNAYADDDAVILAVMVDGAWRTFRMSRLLAGDTAAHLGALADD